MPSHPTGCKTAEIQFWGTDLNEFEIQRVNSVSGMCNSDHQAPKMRSRIRIILYTVTEEEACCEQYELQHHMLPGHFVFSQLRSQKNIKTYTITFLYFCNATFAPPEAQFYQVLGRRSCRRSSSASPRFLRKRKFLFYFILILASDPCILHWLHKSKTMNSDEKSK